MDETLIGLGVIAGTLFYVGMKLGSIADSLRSIEIDIAAIRRKHGY